VTANAERHWHPHLRVERVIRELLSARWSVHNRVTAKKVLGGTRQDSQGVAQFRGNNKPEYA